MKQIVLFSPHSSVPCPLGGQLLYGDDGAVYLKKKPQDSPTRTIRCVGCAHLQAEEFNYGIRKGTCAEGHFRNPRDQYRWYSANELLNPSRDLSTIARACSDFTPASGQAA